MSKFLLRDMVKLSMIKFSPKRYGKINYKYGKQNMLHSILMSNFLIKKFSHKFNFNAGQNYANNFIIRAEDHVNNRLRQFGRYIYNLMRLGCSSCTNVQSIVSIIFSIAFSVVTLQETTNKILYRLFTDTVYNNKEIMTNYSLCTKCVVY